MGGYGMLRWRLRPGEFLEIDGSFLYVKRATRTKAELLIVRPDELDRLGISITPETAENVEEKP